MPLNESVYRKKQREDEERRKREQAVEMFTSGAQSSSNTNSGNSSTSSQNSSQTSQGGSQSPSAISKLFHSTARKYSNATANDPTRRNSRGQEVSSKARTRSAVNSPKATGTKIKEDTGEWAKNEAYGALTGFNKELASAADFLLPDVITPKKVQNVLDYYRNADEEQQQKVQASRGDSKLREIAGTIGGETLKNIPAAAMAMLSGGTSVGAQVAGKAVPSLLEGAQMARTGNIVQRAMSEVARTSGQNPMFWETFMRTVGPTYDKEIQNGADPIRATLSAYANALLNAQIEIGGGVEVYDPSEVFWKAALRSAKEEGLEEVQQYAVENLTNKAIGSNTAKWFSMNRGEDAVINPIDMAEQGFYGAAAGGLMSGGRTLGVNAVNSIRNDNYRNANPDIEERANELIQRASLQGREGEMATRAQNLAEEVSDQMARGKAPTAYQMRELERAVATDEYYNDKAYQESSQARYNQAVNEGRANTVESTGTADEYYGFQRGLTETEQRNYERAKAVMGEDASERSVAAVGRFMTGSESNSDIDTILLDPEAKSAVEELTDVTLPINNTKARTELENLALAHNIANNDRILEETHNEIRTNMSRRGGEFFDQNYDEAVATIDEPNAADIYESFFSRFYTAGTVEGADFEKTYNRIISPLVEDFGEELGTKISQVFNHDFAQKVFAEGQIAMNSVRAKAQGRSLSVKASENPAGFTYEEEARKHISDREADLFTKLAERAKVHIRLVSSIAGGQANGSYDPETGVILIAADSDNKFITVFKHELTHHLKNTSPEMYQKLEDFVFKRWYDGDPEKMEERVQEYQRRYGMKPDEAREEIIADVSEAFFTDQGAINDAVTFNEKMARAIHDGIKSLLDTFLDLVDTDRRADKGYGDFLKDLDILRDAEKMWLETLNDSVGKHKGSTESGAFVDNSTGENVQFSLRTEAPPKKTKKGYKVFVVKNGELYPPMVANPNGDPTPVGVWLNADEGVRAGTSKTGRPQVQAGGKGTQGGSGTLAYRPGWHLGEIPLAKQFMRQDANGNKTLFPKNFVWAECDIAADNDYQEEAMSYGYTENGKFRHAYAGLPKIPKDGFYQYRTNPNPDTVPWLITGAMKINRILSDAEVSNILAKEGIEAPKRQGGDKTLEELGIKKVKFSRKSMSDKYEADEKLTHSQFNSWYSAHKLDLRGRGNIAEQIESIKANGFRGDGGFMGNIMPASINDSLDRDGLPRSFFKDKKGWDDEKIDSYLNRHKWVDDVYYPGMTVSDQRYGVRKGETVLLVPRTWTDQKFGRVKQGFKPREYEIVTADRNFQPYYELYEKAYDETHKKYSLKSDQDYMDAVNKGDMETAQRMVDEYAKKHGYGSPMLYHGTRSFGFTRFDLSHGYEWTPTFATNNKLTAGTYSGETQRGKISERSPFDVNDLQGQQLLDVAKKYLKKYSNFKVMPKALKEEEIKDAKEGIRYEIQAFRDFIENNKYAFDDEKMSIVNGMIDALGSITEAKGNDEIWDAWEKYQDLIWDFKWADESLFHEFYEAVSDRHLLIYKNRIDDLIYDGTLYYNDELGLEYVFDNQVALELDAEMHKGIYSLYGNIDNMLIVDAEGANWNQIMPPEELNLYGTQKTRDIAETAKAMGYSGVIFKNLKDNGGETAYNGVSDVYVFFNANALKSADPVTYDDNGNVIPLSERFNESNDDIRYSLKEMDDAYNKAVDSNDTATAERLVKEAADRAGYKTEGFHGSLNASFTVFDKRRSTVAGNSGAGFYFSSNEEDSKLNYEDVEGADNQTKIDAFFDMLLEEGEWNGEEIEDADQAYAIAKRELSKKPGTYHVFLRYNDPYVRDYDNSTNIFDKIMDGFDESVVDRNDFDTDDDYQDALMQERDEYFYGKVDDAVRGAISDLEDFYDYVSIRTDIDAIVRHIAEDAFDYERLTWDDINEYLNDLGDIEIMSDNDADMGWGAPELSRAIIENFGYDAIEDKEAGTKFRQLEERGMSDTEHIIVFHPNQIKSADAITYDSDGNVIPLSQRFNLDNEDIRYSLKKAPPVEELDKSGATLTTNNGQPIAKFEENGSVQFSLKTYDDQGRRIYKEYLDKMVKNGQLSRAEAKQMFDEIETIYKISREFADTGKYAPFTAWSNAQVVTGENGKPVFSAIKKNSEYKMNIDFSTICKKRRTLDNVFRVMVNRGLFEKLDLNKDESAALVVNINDLIREHGFEAACALCFVEARRYRQQQTATTFRDMWNGLVESMYKDKSKIEYFNYGENNEQKPVPDGIHTMPDKDLNLTKLKRLANAKNDEGKPLQTAEAKAARLLLRDPSQRKLMLVGDMMASTGFENMQVKNPELMKIYNAKKGTGGAKSSFGDVQYLNEILRPRTFGRMSAYAVSGVRIQSFSDYVPRMVFDYVQVIGDLAAKRLPAHAYTKEVLFALQFGLTGVKINMSLVPDVVADGVAPGLDKNGNYIWNKEGTFPWEDYVDKNGRKMPGARSIQKAKGYKEHCGTIAVGISDAQIWKMLLDPEIQMVIPYHKSSLNPLVAAMTNVDRFTDYTDYQNTRDKNGKAVEKEFDWDRKLFRLSHGSNNKLLPRSEWGDVQALVKEYVDWCNKHEYTPKFSQFLYMREGNSMDGDFILDENGNKVINPGYYKMLEDFALYDNDGKFKPQDDVRMNFPTDESAYGSMASLIEQGLDEDAKLEAKRTNEIDGIVDEIEGMIEDGSITKQTIFSEALADKMEDKFQYSLKSGGESRNYQNTISKLENQVKDLKSEFKRTNLKTADQKQVRIQAGKLITRHGSNMQAQKSLIDTFNEIFRLYKENGTDAFDEVYEIAKNEAVNIVNNISVVHNEGEETYKAIKDYLKNTPITISEDMKRNITDFNDFRKRYFGKLKITNGNTTNIDTVYMELMELFPEQFTEDYVNPADQLYHMADVLDNYAPYYETLDGASPEMQDYVVDIAADIMETAYGLQTKKTFADKKYEEKVKAVAKARQKALESRDSALNRQKKRYEEKLEFVKSHNKEMRDKARARQKAAEERAKEERREKREARREKKKDSEARTRLLEIARRISRIKSTDEFEAIKKALIGELDLEAKSMTGKTKMKLEDLERWYMDQVENNDWFVKNEALEKKFERLRKTHISGMKLEDVQNLTEILLMLEHKVRNDKKLINSQYKKDVFMAALETSKGIKQAKGLRAFGLHKLDDVFVGQSLSPMRYMRRLTGYDESNPLMIATKELQDGEIKTLDYRMNALKPFNRFADLKFVSYLNGRKAPLIKVNATTIDMKPTTVEIIPSIRIWFYLSSLNEDNMRHIVNGGVHIPDAKLLKAGKRTDAYDRGRLVRFSKSQVQAIINGMTAQEKAYADQVYNYFNNVAPKATNEVSEQLDGISVAKVKNYLRISVDKDFLDVDADIIKRDGTLEGMGSHKERVHSSKPVYAEDISDVLMRAIEADSKYVGMAIPIRNFNKIYHSSSMEAARGEAEHKQLTGTVDNSPVPANGMPAVIGNEESASYRTLTGGYVSVQEAIKSQWSSDATEYIDKFISDLQFSHQPAGVVEKGLRKLTSNYAAAVLTLNASVAIKQAASFPTAAAVIGWKPLIKSLGRLGKLDLDYVDSVTPLLNYRTEGFNLRETGDIQNRGNREGFFQRATRSKALNWIQGMDVLTTRKLFKAAQIYVEDNFKLRQGTEAYDKKVAEIYNRIITETQPNYTTMERPGHLRSDSTLERTLSMFKTQPYQNFNIWYDATGNYLAKRARFKDSRNEENRKALKEASKDLYNASTSQIVQLAVFAAMSSLWALFRRKDDKYRDEEGNITFASYMKQIAKDMLSGAASEVFLGSEVFSAMDSKVNGTYYRGFSSVSDSAIRDVFNTMTDTISLVGSAFDRFTKGEEAETTTKDMLKQMKKVGSEMGRFTGIPTGNIMNLINATYNWVAISADGKYVGTYEAQKMALEKQSEMMDNLFQAYRHDKRAYEQIRKMMIEDGIKESSIDYYMKNMMKERKTDSEQREYNSSIQTLEKSSLWKDADAEEKDKYEKILEKIAVGIEDSDTTPYTKYAASGLTEEQTILYKLALKKVDTPNKNGKLGGTPTNAEREAAVRLLEKEFNLTYAQKEALKG